MLKYYAGIGSRETPENIKSIMSRVATGLESMGWTLRSGGAHGADEAFEDGVQLAENKEIYLPWGGYNGRVSSKGVFVGYVSTEVQMQAMSIAEECHPNWAACSPGARMMHARNVCQVLGRNLNEPIKFVCCWTVGGRRGGGTGQALRLATKLGIPIYDLGLPDHMQVLRDLRDFVDNL